MVHSGVHYGSANAGSGCCCPGSYLLEPTGIQDGNYACIDGPVAGHARAGRKLSENLVRLPVEGVHFDEHRADARPPAFWRDVVRERERGLVGGASRGSVRQHVHEINLVDRRLA